MNDLSRDACVNQARLLPEYEDIVKEEMDIKAPTKSTLLETLKEVLIDGIEIMKESKNLI